MYLHILNGRLHNGLAVFFFVLSLLLLSLLFLLSDVSVSLLLYYIYSMSLYTIRGWQTPAGDRLTSGPRLVSATYIVVRPAVSLEIDNHFHKSCKYEGIYFSLQNSPAFKHHLQ